jgi:hypothetical protein
MPDNEPADITTAITTSAIPIKYLRAGATPIAWRSDDDRLYERLFGNN